MSNNNPPVRNAVIAALKAHGPMTRHDLAEHLDWPLERVHSAIAGARRLRPGQIFRVVGYSRPPEGRGKDSSIYAAEAGPDVARKARMDARLKANQKRYRKKHKAVINARLRKTRTLQAGRAIQPNPWAQLAPASMRGLMARAALEERTAQ